MQCRRVLCGKGLPKYKLLFVAKPRKSYRHASKFSDNNYWMSTSEHSNSCCIILFSYINCTYEFNLVKVLQTVNTHIEPELFLTTNDRREICLDLLRHLTG